MTAILVAAALFALAGFVTKRYYEGVLSVTRAFFALLTLRLVGLFREFSLYGHCCRWLLVPLSRLRRLSC